MRSTLADDSEESAYSEFSISESTTSTCRRVSLIRSTSYCCNCLRREAASAKNSLRPIASLTPTKLAPADCFQPTFFSEDEEVQSYQTTATPSLLTFMEATECESILTEFAKRRSIYLDHMKRNSVEDYKRAVSLAERVFPSLLTLMSGDDRDRQRQFYADVKVRNDRNFHVEQVLAEKISRSKFSGISDLLNAFTDMMI